MADPQTPNKFLFTPPHGGDVNTWDVPMNANYAGIDQALGAYTTLNATGLSGNIALTASQTIPLGFIVTGTPTGPINYQTPAGVGGLWLVRNRATLGASITLGFSSAAGGPTVNIPAATNIAVSADGSSIGMVDIDTGTGTAAGSNTQIQFNVLGALGAAAGFIYDSATSTQHTPNLSVDGNAVFGSGAGSTMTINGVPISAPNGFNFNAGQFEMTAAGLMGIGVAPTASQLAVGGVIEATAGGFKFPDTTVQTTAALSETGTWTPVDASGASLVFLAATGRYQRIGPMMILTYSITYPANADGSPTAVGGAPATAANLDYANSAGSVQNSGGSALFYAVMIKNTKTFGLWSGSAGRYNNSQLNGITISGCIIYPVS